MLEKDIENLIAQYPEEFFPNKKMELQGQQVKLGSYYADIIFNDGYGDIVVIEVKRGILTREAMGQIMDYYGVLREENPSKNIKLILAANVIPRERAMFLAEKLGIDFMEIPISKVIEMASKYSYKFLDSEDPAVIQEFQKTSRLMDEKVDVGKSSVWIFQANPERYQIQDAISDSNIKENHWLVNQHKNRISKGDICLICVSGKKNGGIYAVGEITSNPEYLIDSDTEAKYWTSEDDKGRRRLRVSFTYKIKIANNPLSKEEMKNVPELKNLSIFKQPQGTNFPVKDKEWEIISEMIKNKISA